MVLVYFLSIFRAAEYPFGDPELRDSDQSLDDDQDVGDESEDSVDGAQSVFGVFVEFNDDKG